ncbi:hypothetical protein [Streptomyces sp. NBC_01092]|nr:hypothetical protein OG254_45040 [Streptomyces sp. NBC_01092]
MTDQVKSPLRFVEVDGPLFPCGQDPQRKFLAHLHGQLRQQAQAPSPCI